MNYGLLSKVRYNCFSRLAQCMRRYSSKSNRKSDENNIGGKQDEEQGGYMKKRLEQLQEDAVASDPTARSKLIEQLIQEGKSVGSLVEKDMKMAEIYTKLLQKKFEDEFAAELSYAKIPSYADAATKDIAISKPWTGGESASDVAKSLHSGSKAANQKSLPETVRLPFKRKLSVSERIDRAREKSLDYSLLKHSDENDNFKELYRERLLGPEQVSRVSFAAATGSIKGMADAQIEAARERGEFDNLPRGKPMKNVYDNSSPYLDQTDFHLNNILKRQEVKLPWIEKQGTVTVEINKFRQKLKDEWINKAVHLIDNENAGKPSELKVKKARYYAENPTLLRDKVWEDQKRQYLKVALRHLNDSIRGYNLQAPMPSQKFYLIADKELERCYKDAGPEIVSAVKRFLYPSETKQSTKQYRQSSSVYYSPAGASLGSLFRSMFKK